MTRLPWWQRLEGRLILSAATAALVPMLILWLLALYTTQRQSLKLVEEQLSRVSEGLETPAGTATGVVRFRYGLARGVVAVEHGFGHWAFGAEPRVVAGRSYPV